jgi:photosystem II stability/assembly factor-like uncharacterized protein
MQKQYLPASFTLLLLFANIIPCFPQWVQTSGPSGSINVVSYVSNPAVSIVSTGCGIYNSTDQGETWVFKLTDSFNASCLYGDSLFYGGEVYGIYLLNISAATYEPAYCGLAGYKVFSLSSGGSILYAGTEYGGFQSASTGLFDWTPHNNGLPGDTIWTPFGYIISWNVAATSLQDNYLFAGTSKGVYRSLAGQFNWISANTGLPVQAVGFITAINNELFAGIQNTIYRSTDHGNTWSVFYSAGSHVTSILKTGGIYYVSAFDEGIVFSSNGVNWVSMNEGLTNPDVNFITLSNNGLIAGTQSKGIFLFADDVWQAINNGISCASIRSMAAVQNDLVACDNMDVYYTDDGGNSWLTITPPVERQHLGMLVAEQDSVYLSYHSPSGQRITFTHDSGNTWTELNPPPYEGDDAYRLGLKGDTLFAFEDNRMFYTTDLGMNWIDTSLPPEYCNMFDDFIVYHSDCFATACGNAEFLRMTINGQWILSNIGLPAYGELVFIGKAENSLYAYNWSNGMYISMDNGHTWNPANDGLAADLIRGYAYFGHNFFITSDYGVFFTSDYGSNWSDISEGLPNTGELGDIVLLHDTLFIGTYNNAVWKRPVSEIPVIIKEPQDTWWPVIYPNPNGGSFRISNLKGGDKSIVSITDLAGRKIYRHSFDAGMILVDIPGLQDGIYFLSLETGNERYSMKLIIK